MQLSQKVETDRISEHENESKVNEASAGHFENENVNMMSDEDFCEHLWQKYCGRSRPAEFCSQRETMLAKVDEENDFDDGRKESALSY